MVWKDIPLYEGKYQASADGQIRRLYIKAEPKILSQIVKQQKCGTGRYTYVNLVMDGRRKAQKVSKLVFSAFRGDFPEDLCLLHKNGDFKDNGINNLILVDRRELGRLTGMHSERRRPVARINLKGEIVNIYPSIRAASRAVGVSYTSIADYCNDSTRPLGKDRHYWVWGDDIEY